MPAAEPVDHRPLVERVRPTRLKEMVGNASAIQALRRWADSWEEGGRTPPPRRAVLLEGPPGVGKTTAALALARERGWSIVEMNASDARNQDAIASVAGRAAATNTLGDEGRYRGVSDGGRTLILLDEADCLTGRAVDESASVRAAPTALREFLRTRYRTVEALAAAWGLGTEGRPAAFERWESVPATGGRGAWTRLPAAQRDLADWRSASRPKDTSDRGGLGAIARLVRETRQPLVLTVNDPTPLTRYSPIFRQAVVHGRFAPVPEDVLKGHLLRVAEREGFRVSPEIIGTIAGRSQGDVRAALTDLEAVSVLPDAVTAQTLFGARNVASSHAEFVDDVFRHPRFYRSVEVRDRLDSRPDDLLPWIEENLPRSGASPENRYAAYEVLDRSEQFLAWARRHRVFGLWSYASELMTGGVSLALAADGPRRPGDVGFPEFLAMMGRSRGLRATRLSVVSKVGRRLHVSRRKAIEALLPFLERLFVGPSGAGVPDSVLTLRRAVAREIGLTAEELAFLLGADPEGAEVQAIARPDEPPVEEPPGTPAAPPAAREDRRKVQKRLAEF